MDDFYAEQIIKSAMTVKELAIRFAVIALCVIAIPLSFILGIFSIVIIFLVVYLAWYVIGLTNVEYEYSVLNSELRIDKILGQKKRKKQGVYDIKQADVMEYLTSGKLEGLMSQAKIVDYSSHTNSNRKIGIVFHDSEKNTVVVIEPNERIIETISKAKPSLTRNLKDGVNLQK